VNTDAPWPTLEEATSRVLRMQAKLHQWATDSPDRRFCDLFNLVHDPAFLTVVDGVKPRDIIFGTETILPMLRAGRACTPVAPHTSPRELEVSSAA